MSAKKNPLNLNKKYFELDQAEAQLPRIRDYLQQLQELKMSIQLWSNVEITPSGEDGEEEIEEEIEENGEEDFAYQEHEEEQEFKEESITPDYLFSSTPLHKQYHKALYEFYTILEQLEKIGCLVKDIDEGLIDFFHCFEGRDVFLCWKAGEERITHWHEIEDGFAGRKKIIRQPFNILTSSKKA